MLRRARSELDSCRSMRQAPSLINFDYLHLVDLRDGLAIQLSTVQGLWLDYGARTSPYASLMTGAQLESADILGSSAEPEPTYRFEPGKACPAPNNHYDGIISTQVLEHVECPADYLRDTARMLRRGGLLLLTTHGIWKDHPLPADYWRWTAQGLRLEVESAGFDVRDMVKLTCGARAITTLALVQLAQLLGRGWLPARWSIQIGGRMLAIVLNGIVGRLTRSSGRLSEGNAKLYLALLVVAVKR
jgi:SAM-dependent methyltransferase